MSGRISYFGGIAKDGLILYLDAAKKESYPGYGTTWTDITGNGNNGTLISGATFDSENGGSIVFDGTNDYVDCGNKSILNLTNNFTLSAWINRASVQVTLDSGIIGNITNNDGYQGYMLWYNGDTVDLYFAGDNRANSTTTILANTWYNIVGTYNGASACIYINGILDIDSDVITTANSINRNFWIGKYEFGTNRNFTGNISHALVYNRALTASEILQNYNSVKGRYEL